MKNKGLLKLYHNLTLAWKIRFSYLLLLIPMIIVITVCLYDMWETNTRYDEMIDSATAAGEFSLDFKKDFDDEAYLLIVGNKTVEECKMDSLLREANRVIAELQETNPSEDNQHRLDSAKKYLTNLETYKGRIEENLSSGDMYEENIEIWENDIQIVSALLQETMIEYIYYEIQDFQVEKVEYAEHYRNLIQATVFAIIAVTLVIFLLSIYIPLSISKPIEKLSEVTKSVAEGDLTARAEVSAGGEVGTFSESLNTMIDKINELLQQVTDEQIRLRKAELELLQAQINPHFLYNTLDTIVWLAEGGDPKQVVGMVKSLSDFFRASLNQGKEVVTVREELVHVRSYLEIQQVRYQDIMTYNIDVSEDVYACLIPKITIQPLVENALYHGIKNKRGMGTITITGAVCDGKCILKVTDNGIGMDADRLKKINDRINGIDAKKDEIFGLSNVNERIQLKFGKEYGITISSIYGDGTCVDIVLPLENADMTENVTENVESVA